MKMVLTLAASVLLVAGCSGLWIGTAGDRAFCMDEATDQVEREASRELCRWI